MIKIFLQNYLFNSSTGSVVKIISRICFASSALSVAGLIIVLNIMNDMSLKIQERLLGSEPHISLSLDSKKNIEYKKQWKKMHVFLKKKKNIKYMYFVKKHELIIKSRSSGLQSVFATEFNKKDFSIFLKNTYKQYPFLKSVDAFEYQKSRWPAVYVEEDLAQSLALKKNDIISLFKPVALLSSLENLKLYKQLKIKGLLASESKNSFEKKIYFSNLDKNKQLFSIDLQLHQPYKYKKLFKNIKQFAKSISLPIQITNWKKDNHILFFSLKMEKSIMTLFFIISLLINSLSIMTLIFLLIAQKRRDIYILFSMGLSKKHIKKLFMKMGFVLSLLGMSAGLLLGLAVSVYLHYYPLQILPDIFYNTSISSKIDIFVLSASLLSILFFSYIAAWLPIHIQFKKIKIEQDI